MVTWSRAAVVLGMLLLVAGFGFGVEPTSASGNPVGYSCGSEISARMLTSGTAATPAVAAASLTPQDRASEARCQPVRRFAAWLTWGGLGTGFLLLVVGWTILREEGGEAPRPLTRPAVSV